MTGLAIIAAKSLIKVLLFMAIAVSTLGTGIPSSLASKTPAIVRLSLSFRRSRIDPVVELECATRAALGGLFDRVSRQRVGPGLLLRTFTAGSETPAAARRKIAASQRARWAKLRAQQKKAA